jgi:hypothetical protein
VSPLLRCPHRRPPPTPTISESPKPPRAYPSTAYYPQHAPAATAVTESNDSVSGADDWGGPEELGTRVRRRYVQALQVMLQRQLNVLVERCRVGALVCVVAAAARVRWLAASKVFDEMMVAEGARQGRGCAGTEAFCHWRCQSVSLCSGSVVAVERSGTNLNLCVQSNRNLRR